MHNYIASLIQKNGPISVEEFLQIALYHPEFGYYQRQTVLGRQGDFITAPEISQVFGELIALWIFETWQQLGSKTPIQFIELGPGRGTMMADILRTLERIKAFPISELSVHLVEVSPFLRQQQKIQLSKYTFINWTNELATVPEQESCFILANEFFDALPIQQYDENNELRRINIDENGLLFFVNECSKEQCPSYFPIIEKISKHLKASASAALIIDYGDYTIGNRTGETLQALKNHGYCSIFEEGADLSHQVNFKQLEDDFKTCDTQTLPVITQGQFLTSLGIDERTAALCKNASIEQKNILLSGSARLIAPSHMGELFKVMKIIKQ
jgi:SAM-dependent MidA family methyltransferase